MIHPVTYSMSDSREIVIEVRGLWAGYNGEAVLENIDMNVYRGDFLGIIGPNGGGKSTLLKVVLGLLHPIRGRIRVLGRPPSEGRVKIGYVPQFTTYDKEFPISVWDVVLMGRRSKRGMLPFYNREDKEAATRALEEVEMSVHKKKHINDLSGGQRQRVFVARALCSEPEILILDEPTASVDKKLQDSIYGLLKTLNERITIILVTHDIGVVASYVARVACLNRRLFVNDDGMISRGQLEEVYGCPVDLIAHGVPHRVLPEHRHE